MKSVVVGFGLASALLLALGGCARRGLDVPSLARVRTAAWNAVRDPHTWVPATGALVFDAAGLDEDVSDWAAGAASPGSPSESARLFGSRRAAEQASDVLLYGVGPALAVAPSLLRPRAPGAVGRLAHAAGTAASTFAVGEAWKRSWQRRRPDGSDARSYPSGHAYLSSAAAAVARIHYRRASAPPRYATAWDVATTGVAALTGYARVEAKKHYPSDVLAGYALGNFMAVLLHDLWGEARSRTRFVCTANPGREGTRIEAGLRCDL